MMTLHEAATIIWNEDRPMRPRNDPDADAPLIEQSPIVQARYASKAIARQLVMTTKACGQADVFYLLAEAHMDALKR